MGKNYFYSCFIALFLLAGCTTDSPDKKVNAHRNDLVLGASARDFLSDELFTAIDLEIVYVTGFEPTAEALNSLRTFFERNTHKPNGISIQTRAISSPDVGSYSIEEIKAIEKKYRTAFSVDNRLAVFIFFADEKSQDSKEGTNILGKAYMNTSMVIFDSVIKSMNGSRSEIQTVTLHHEFGHLFGLVDNGTPAQSEHEDENPEHKAHCNVEGCLMAAKIDVSSSPLSFLENGVKILELDEHCKLDLKANGGK
ncbi:hypothetical protein [Salinimicrobium sp. HB62]|uniref:hypothetical protein n=1 Tax=Salinimicrobium sp. HB62 TaxID=3077781 RepID=UPI002D78D87B|nr:hypothetical protein [Salinimicrobium sp. HB62]